MPILVKIVGAWVSIPTDDLKPNPLPKSQRDIYLHGMIRPNQLDFNYGGQAANS